MPRNITSQMINALAADVTRPAIFCECQFSNGTVYFWTGFGQIVWNGQTWNGVGNFGTLSTVEEGSAVEAKGITIGLTGLDAVLLSEALNELELGSPCVIYFGLFDDTKTLIPDPFISFAGDMDQPTISVSGNTADLNIAVESKLLAMNVPASRRYTDSDCRSLNPNDAGCSFVTSIQQATLYWGRSPNSTNNI